MCVIVIIAVTETAAAIPARTNPISPSLLTADVALFVSRIVFISSANVRAMARRGKDEI